MNNQPKIGIPTEKIKEFCHKWKIAEFSLFGTVFEDDFNEESPIEVAVRIEDYDDLSLSDWVDMIEELKCIFGRDVRLVDEAAVRNPFRRHLIKTTKEVLYAA